jgi:SulP family sulfate permease
LFHRDNVYRNVVAGIVVAVITLPLSMAFAIASGAKPEAGIYTSIVAVIIVSLFGGSRVQITGPTSAFVGILLGVSSKYGLGGLQIATIMAGMIMLAMGIFKCGRMIRFIPEQVISGFTAGIAVNMLSSQIPSFLGMQCDRLPVALHEKIAVLASTFSTIDPVTTAIGLSSIGVILICQKFLPKIPGPLAALVFGIAAMAAFKFESVDTIGSVFSGLPSKLPSFTPTAPLSFSLLQGLIGSAFAIAMLGSIESLLCAVIADSLAGTKHSSNQELIGHGVANIVSPLLGGIASTGSIARTIASVRMGSNCPIAGLASALVLCLIICTLAPLAKFIPLATLSAILFVVAFRMINCKHCYNLIAHGPKSDAAVLVLTFGLTLFCGIVMAVYVGVMLSALMLMHRMAGSSSIGRQNTGKARHCDYDFSNVPSGIAVYFVSGPIFFGMTDKFSAAFTSIESSDRVVILRMFDVPFIDATGLENLRLISESLKRRGIVIMLSEVTDPVMHKLKRSRMLDSSTVANAGKSIGEVVEAATKFL